MELTEMIDQIEKRLADRGHSNPKAAVKEMSGNWRVGPIVDGDVFDPVDVMDGDYVDFGAYGRLFVIRAPGDDKLWVTDKRADRYNYDAPGWYISRNKAKKILEEA